MLLLSVPPTSGHCLIIIGWIPVGIKHHQTIGSNQIQTTPTCFTAQHEYEFGWLYGYKKDKHCSYFLNNNLFNATVSIQRSWDKYVCFTIRHRKHLMYAYKTFERISCSILDLKKWFLKIYQFLFPKCTELEFCLPLL